MLAFVPADAGVGESFWVGCIVGFEFQEKLCIFEVGDGALGKAMVAEYVLEFAKLSRGSESVPSS